MTASLKKMYYSLNTLIMYRLILRACERFRIVIPFVLYRFLFVTNTVVMDMKCLFSVLIV